MQRATLLIKKLTPQIHTLKRSDPWHARCYFNKSVNDACGGFIMLEILVGLIGVVLIIYLLVSVIRPELF